MRLPTASSHVVMLAACRRMNAVVCSTCGPSRHSTCAVAYPRWGEIVCACSRSLVLCGCLRGESGSLISYSPEPRCRASILTTSLLAGKINRRQDAILHWASSGYDRPGHGHRSLCCTTSATWSPIHVGASLLEDGISS
jgi:hypothetical protein